MEKADMSQGTVGRGAPRPPPGGSTKPVRSPCHPTPAREFWTLLVLPPTVARVASRRARPRWVSLLEPAESEV